MSKEDPYRTWAVLAVHELGNVLTILDAARERGDLETVRQMTERLWKLSESGRKVLDESV